MKTAPVSFLDVFHIARGEYNFLLTNAVLGGVAAFIAYRRLCSGLVQIDTHALTRREWRKNQS
jgi:hypothetical protein